MLVGEDSPLWQLPVNLNPKRRLFLDGIRYSIEMADLAHSRLRETLLVLTEEHAINQQGLQADRRFVVSAVLDAWAIVDSVHRLRGLLLKTPRFKQKSPNMRLFRDRTAKVEDLRNSVQHLNEEVDKLLPQKLPVWGVLSWFVVPDPNSQIGYACALRTGTEFEGYTSDLKIPQDETVSLPIDRITLTAHGQSVSLSDVMQAVKR